jgi:hypothetical protein
MRGISSEEVQESSRLAIPARTRFTLGGVRGGDVYPLLTYNCVKRLMNSKNANTAKRRIRYSKAPFLSRTCGIWIDRSMARLTTVTTEFVLSSSFKQRRNNQKEKRKKTRI